MKILKLTKTQTDPEFLKLLERHNVYITEMRPSAISALTSLKVARTIDRDRHDIVMVDNTKDAIASLSARKITKNGNHKTVYRARPNSAPMTGQNKEIAAGIDGWIFASRRQASLFSPTLSNIMVTDYLTTVLKQIEHREHTGRKIVSWIGQIDRPDKLKEAIDQVDTAVPEFELHIYGMGNARDTMPVVRWARAIAKPQLIMWHGEYTDAADKIAQSDIILKTNDDYTDIELLAAFNGIPVVEPSDISLTLDGGDVSITKRPDQEANIQQLISYLSDIINN